MHGTGTRARTPALGRSAGRRPPAGAVPPAVLRKVWFGAFSFFKSLLRNLTPAADCGAPGAPRGPRSARGQRRAFNALRRGGPCGRAPRPARCVRGRLEVLHLHSSRQTLKKADRKSLRDFGAVRAPRDGDATSAGRRPRETGSPLGVRSGAPLGPGGMRTSRGHPRGSGVR